MDQTWMWLLIVFAWLSVLFGVMGTRKQQPPRSKAVDVPAHTLPKVRELIAQRKEIEAVRAIRTETGWSLRHAKQYVDALRDGTPPPAFHPAGSGEVDAGVDAEVRRLVAMGKKIQAIKVLRDHTGWDLKQCRDYVDVIHRA